MLATLEAIDDRFLGPAEKPFALTSPASYDLTEFSRAARNRFPHVPCLNEPERAFRAIRAVLDYRRNVREAGAATAPASPMSGTPASGTPASTPGSAEATARVESPRRPGRLPHQGVAVHEAAATARIETLRLRAEGTSAAFPLSEPESKELVAAFGIPLIEEGMARTAEEAQALAGRIGYPVVVKGVAADLTHKSDAGAVRVNVGDAASVERACREIARNVAAHDPDIRLDGWLVARMAPAGLELVLGMQRDPEMGAVIMFGAGGVWLELVKDVAFGPPGISREGAARLIESTRIGRLLDGYRGAGPYDRDAVVDALVALGRLAAAAGDVIESVDVNPFLACPQGAGGLALDALAVVAAGTRDRESDPGTVVRPGNGSLVQER